MISYLENPKEFIKTILGLISKCKVAGYKINAQNQLYFYTVAMNNMNMCVRKVNPHFSSETEILRWQINMFFLKYEEKNSEKTSIKL